ncbi:alpha/beta hydrolase [Aureimonas fodinaquatilis]|uniref:alpha/beta hydrolase n=1 Tax=Aureimonas fodinaquatilis TaxID=2565783 RepID=UPI001FE9353A|nr:alpha/beta-hydrolase family protein [Aureimonas fodinaquatilis]
MTQSDLAGRNIPRHWFKRLSTTGIFIGGICLAASLTPSLIPRSYMVQGVLSGTAFAVGYAAGVFAVWLWLYLQLPTPRRSIALWLRLLTALLVAALAVLCLWKAAEWQNSIRALMQMPPVDTAHPFRTGLIAALVFLVWLALARLFSGVVHRASAYLQRVLPRRVANVLAAAVAIALFWGAIEGVLFRQTLHLVDSSFRELDSYIDADTPPPADPMKTGSSQSLIAWESLGARGREFIATGPDAAEIGAFFSEPAMEPLRTYVGLNTRETVQERAAVALQEMLRTGAFEREVLVVVVPTGTGWVDPAAMDPLEYLHRGNIASVAMQYSYLSSWLSLLIEPGYGAEAGRALFQAVYEHWTGLPPGERPRLYLYGLSLGAMNSELSTDLFEVIADPFQGALWAGPPFPSYTWRKVTNERLPSTTEWLPSFRDGAIIRFTGQKNNLENASAPWGPVRIVYLQYASDPVTFFSPSSAYREPDWMKSPRGPDVSPELRWFPVVTMLQLAVDMMLATTTPIGYGHIYAPEHYIDAWMEVTSPPPLSPEELDRLKKHHAARFE